MLTKALNTGIVWQLQFSLWFYLSRKSSSPYKSQPDTWDEWLEQAEPFFPYWLGEQPCGEGCMAIKLSSPTRCQAGKSREDKIMRTDKLGVHKMNIHQSLKPWCEHSRNMNFTDGKLSENSALINVVFGYEVWPTLITSFFFQPLMSLPCKMVSHV